MATQARSTLPLKKVFPTGNILWKEWLAYANSKATKNAFSNLLWTTNLMEAIHCPWPLNIFRWQRWWRNNYGQLGDVPPHLTHVPELMGEDDPALARLIPRTAKAVYHGYAQAQLLFRDIWQGVINCLAHRIIEISESKQGQTVVVFDAGGGTGVKAILILQRIQKITGKIPSILWIVADRQDIPLQLGRRFISEQLQVVVHSNLEEVHNDHAIVMLNMDLFGSEASKYHGIADIVLSCEAMHGDNVVEDTPVWISMMTDFCKPGGFVVAIDMIRHRRIAWVIGFLANLGHLPFKFPLAQCNAGVSSELQSASRQEWMEQISPQLPNWIQVTFPPPGGIWDKVCKGNWFVMAIGVKP